MIRVLFAVLICLCFLSGCGAKSEPRPAEPQAVAVGGGVQPIRTGPPGGVDQVLFRIPRSELIEKLNAGDVNQARLLQIFNRLDPSGDRPEYRLFDVHPRSVYALLGLRTADVIVTVDGFAIPRQDLFWQYLVLLARVRETAIEIRRAGRPLYMHYEFVE